MASIEVRGAAARRDASAAFLAGLLLFSAAGPLLGAEVYGKPLRGLTPVAVRDAVTNPERFEGRDIRVAGPNAGPAGKPELKEGDALLPVVPDGSFKLPEKLEGAKLTAEGRLKKDGDNLVFVASGIEVRR